MSDIDFLLTDEFVAFSAKIAEIHNKKKAKKQELNDFMAKIKGEIDELNKEAEKSKEEFETWKNGTTGVVVSGDKQKTPKNKTDES